MVHHCFEHLGVYIKCGPLVKWPKTPASHAGNTSSNLVRVTTLQMNNYGMSSISCLYRVGADCGEGPPVPIPNTEVKLTCAEDTWRAAARENRKAPTQKETSRKTCLFLCISNSQNLIIIRA